MHTSPTVIVALVGAVSACGVGGPGSEAVELADGSVPKSTAELDPPVLRVAGMTLSWSSVPRADGYNLYRDDRYLTTIHGTSHTAPSAGRYYVTSFDHGGPATVFSARSNVVTVAAPSSRPDAPVLSRSGSTLSWNAVGRADGYNVYLDGRYLTTVTSTTFAASSPGEYYVTAFDSDAEPTSFSVRSNRVQVTSGSAGYRTLFFEGFDGPSLSSRFTTPWSSVPDRAVRFSSRPCRQRDGELLLGFEEVGGELQACYLASTRSDLGPGEAQTLKVQYRADVSAVRARGAWFAGWLYVTSGDGGRDGRPETGMETDVFEYMPTWDTAYNTAAHDGYRNEQWATPLTDFGIDLRRPGHHTFEVEWNRHCQVFSVDGNRVFVNRSPLSTARVHSLMLTMEAQTGTQWGYWDVGDFRANLRRDGAVGRVDWVRVSVRDGAEASLCD